METIRRAERSQVGVATSFVRKLYQMVLDEPDAIVAFCADGKSFEVKDPRRLELEVLPKYFRHQRFQSLVRQLNFYSFKKISKERSIWIYRHDLFQRDKPGQLRGLKRKTNSGGPAPNSGPRQNSHRSGCGGGSGAHRVGGIAGRAAMAVDEDDEEEEEEGDEEFDEDSRDQPTFAGNGGGIGSFGVDGGDGNETDDAERLVPRSMRTSFPGPRRPQRAFGSASEVKEEEEDRAAVTHSSNSRPARGAVEMVTGYSGLRRLAKQGRGRERSLYDGARDGGFRHDSPGGSREDGGSADDDSRPAEWSSSRGSGGVSRKSAAVERWLQGMDASADGCDDGGGGDLSCERQRTGSGSSNGRDMNMDTPAPAPAGLSGSRRPSIGMLCRAASSESEEADEDASSSGRGTSEAADTRSDSSSGDERRPRVRKRPRSAYHQHAGVDYGDSQEHGESRAWRAVGGGGSDDGNGTDEEQGEVRRRRRRRREDDSCSVSEGDESYDGRRNTAAQQHRADRAEDESNYTAAAAAGGEGTSSGDRSDTADCSRLGAMANPADGKARGGATESDEDATTCPSEDDASSNPATPGCFPTAAAHCAGAKVGSAGAPRRCVTGSNGTARASKNSSSFDWSLASAAATGAMHAENHCSLKAAPAPSKSLTHTHHNARNALHAGPATPAASPPAPLPLALLARFCLDVELSLGAGAAVAAVQRFLRAEPAFQLDFAHYVDALDPTLKLDWATMDVSAIPAAVSMAAATAGVGGADALALFRTFASYVMERLGSSAVAAGGDAAMVGVMEQARQKWWRTAAAFA